MTVSEQKRDTRGFYREFQGLRYSYRASRKTYCNQHGGKQVFLHRSWWESHNGEIPKGYVVVPIGDDWEDFSLENWVCQSHAHNGRNFKEKKHPWQEFCGVRYYLRPTEGYYYSSSGGVRVFMHRMVYSWFHGPIPEGHHIHHIDMDRSNNQVGNLQCLSAPEHKRLHHQLEKAAVKHKKLDKST